jgi:hypothetical protein
MRRLSYSSHLRHVLVATLLVLTAVLSGCSGWRALPEAGIEQEHSNLIQQRVRFYTEESVISMQVIDVQYPYVMGRDYTHGWRDPIQVDLREVTRIEVYNPGNPAFRRFVKIGVVVTVSLAALALALAAMGANIVF